jgi:hypothetical protein
MAKFVPSALPRKETCLNELIKIKNEKMTLLLNDNQLFMIKAFLSGYIFYSLVNAHGHPGKLNVFCKRF